MTLQPWDQPAPESDRSLPAALGLSMDALRDVVRELGEKPFRARQLFEGLHAQRWPRWEAFTTLPKALRSALPSHLTLGWPTLVASHPSEDGSTKHAFRLEDARVVEGVHMPYEDRTTLCLSSQVGCAMGCTFCATGQLGILRNLGVHEIVGQVYAMLAHHGHPAGRPVNLVFMGMGEPLHNLDHVMGAFDLLTHPDGLAIPPRRITLSTSGLVTGIQRLGAFPRRPRLAVSLNATTDEARSRIMPVNRVWSLDALAAALKAFPLEPGERITLEYVLLAGVTDTPEDAKRLIAFARRFPSKVNLIPFNAHEGEAGAKPHGAKGAARGGHAMEGVPVGEAGGPRVCEGTEQEQAPVEPALHGEKPHGAEGAREGTGFQPPSEAHIDLFGSALARAGLTVMVRRSRGQDVAGACGQLARKGVGA